MNRPDTGRDGRVTTQTTTQAGRWRWPAVTFAGRRCADGQQVRGPARPVLKGCGQQGNGGGTVGPSYSGFSISNSFFALCRDRRAFTRIGVDHLCGTIATLITRALPNPQPPHRAHRRSAPVPAAPPLASPAPAATRAPAPARHGRPAIAATIPLPGAVRESCARRARKCRLP